MSVHVEPLADCLPAALAFRNASRTSTRDERYIRWRYLDRPGPAPAFVVWIREGGQDLAAATVAPHTVLLRGQRLSIGVVGDISVAEAARGRGLAALLMQEVVTGARTLDGLMVMPNPPMHATFRKGGWIEVPGLVRFARVIAGGGVTRVLAGTLSKLRALPAALRRRADGYRLEKIANLPEGYEAFWNAINLPFAASRESAYLAWRYLAHPLHRYELFALHAGERLAGYAIARNEGGDWWIDDWLAVNSTTADVLGAKLVEQARLAGVAGMHTRTQAQGVACMPWRNLGFLLRADTQAVFVAGPWAARASAAKSDWYLTPGDKDV